jgi:NADPH:quinone reductase-like Zn-dependent oxidoreductase
LKAIVYTQYGGPEFLQLKDVEKPLPREGEVLVKVYATSINDWDWAMMDGRSVFNRLFSGFRKPKYPILGSDIAGTVEAVGKNVQKLRPGDKVFGDLSGRWGGFAEYVCAGEKALAIKPAEMTFEQAAAIPQAAMLAVQGLIDQGHIQRGQKLLINGAGGGVGTIALQIARLYDVEVTAVDSPEKLEMLRVMGASYVIDYTKEDFTKNNQRYDLILDVKTNRPVLRYLRALHPKGSYVTVGGSLPRLFQLFLLRPFVSMFSKKKVKIVMLKPNKDLAYMIKLFQAGIVKPVIDGHYNLEDVANAFRLFGKGGHKGKLVISIIKDHKL